MKDYVEAGDHYFYICTVDEVYGDEDKNPFFAFDGYSRIDALK